jgi:hypothetical protein
MCYVLAFLRAGAIALKGKVWDKPVVPMPQVERQLLSEADVQRLFVRRGVTTETGR